MHAMKISTKISVCALFCVLGFLGNWFKLPLFFNVDFLFGSLFTMLTIMAVAGACGIITGTVVSEAARKILADWIQEHHRNVQILSILVGDPNADTFEHTQHCVEILKLPHRRSGAGEYSTRPPSRSVTLRWSKTASPLWGPICWHVGKGTGLGLAVVHGIVKRHGGEILVRGDVGKWSVFEVLIPVAEFELKRENVGFQALPKGRERILLVDDEACDCRDGG